MSRSQSHWILLTACHVTETHISPEGDFYECVIAPNDNLKKGDTVYLWWNPGNYFYGWGTVAKTPRTFYDSDTQKRRKQQAVLVNRVKELCSPLTEQVMLKDNRLKKIVPTGFDDLYAIPLRPEQANYLNDFVREHKLDRRLKKTVGAMPQFSAPRSLPMPDTSC